MKQDKDNNDNIIKQEAGEINRTVNEIEEALISAPGSDIQKLATFIYLLCDSDTEMYKKTIDLIKTIDDFKEKLNK